MKIECTIDSVIIARMSVFTVHIIGSLWVITLFQHFDIVLSVLRCLLSFSRSCVNLFVELLQCVWFYVCAGCFYEFLVYLYNLKYEAPTNRMKLQLEEDFDNHLKESWIPFRSLSVDDTLTEQWKASNALRNELSTLSRVLSCRSLKLLATRGGVQRRVLLLVL